MDRGPADTYVAFTVYDDDDGEKRMTADNMMAAAAKFTEQPVRFVSDDLVRRVRSNLRELNAGVPWLDLEFGDLHAGDCDVLLQVAAFGEVVFG